MWKEAYQKLTSRTDQIKFQDPILFSKRYYLFPDTKGILRPTYFSCLPPHIRATWQPSSKNNEALTKNGLGPFTVDVFYSASRTTKLTHL